MTPDLLILGCGYVGTALARHYRTLTPARGITATTTTPARLGELGAIADQALVLPSSDSAQLAAQLHRHRQLLVSVGAKRGTPYADTYLQTAIALTQALANNDSIEQIVYTSSYSVYGDRQGAWVTEDSPLPADICPGIDLSASDPSSSTNAQVLAATEARLLALATPQRRVCIFRLGGIYGPGRELEKIFAFAAGKTRPGDGSDASNWVHRDDIVGAIAFAFEHPLQGIYNLVNDQPLDSKVLLDWVCDRHQLAPISWDPSQSSLRPYNARVSNQKLRAAGYQFRHPSILAG
ncbi:MAG: SDR family oxidoreductase [Synechococcales cyanobacterium RM1_1_8]|nr:SDR family oxidoreductase [Synechococcales cyanobacterium RM1_1_8]